MYAFGKMMRKLIAEHGTTQAEISRATGINKQNISLMCNGKTQSVTRVHKVTTMRLRAVLRSACLSRAWCATHLGRAWDAKNAR